MTELDWERLYADPRVTVSSTGSYLDAEAAEQDGCGR